MFTELINKLRWEIINILSIDIDLLFHNIDEVNRQLPASHNALDEERKFLLCLYLRGYSQDSIVQKYQSLGLTITKSDLNNKMRSVNAGIRKLTAEKDRCALINYLLEYGYKITNNRADTYLSLGGRYFLSGDLNLERTKATQQFLLQNYDSALASFLQLWDKNASNEETLIYLNNSWLLANQNKLEHKYGIASFKLYRIAVVIPVLYNNGAVAQSLLKGVATLQLKINLALNRCERIHYPLAENFSNIESFKFNNRQKFGLLVCIAKDESDIIGHNLSLESSCQ